MYDKAYLVSVPDIRNDPAQGKMFPSEHGPHWVRTPEGNIYFRFPSAATEWYLLFAPDHCTLYLDHRAIDSRFSIPASEHDE